jgi:hypothetical protein
MTNDELSHEMWKGAVRIREEDEVWIADTHPIADLVLWYRLAFVQLIDGGMYIDSDHFPRVVKWLIDNKRDVVRARIRNRQCVNKLRASR